MTCLRSIHSDIEMVLRKVTSDCKDCVPRVYLPSGCIGPGDEILSVNGRGVQGLSHQQAIQLFRNIKSGQIVILLARRVLQVKK